MTVVTHRVSQANPTTWQPTHEKRKDKESAYDVDAVVHAYTTGRKEGFDHGMNEMRRGFSKLLKDNTTKAATYTDKILGFLKQKGVLTSGTFLKISSWDELNVLILVNQDSFLTPSFKQVYDLVFDIEDESEGENLSLNFTFAPYTSDFNLACIHADGFSLKYDNEGEENVNSIHQE